MSLTVKQLNGIIKELAFGAKRTVFGKEADLVRKRAKPDIEQKLKEGAIIDLLIEVEEEEDELEPAPARKKKERKRAFCATGKDGGLDNSCSPANKGASMESITGTGDPSDSLGGDLSRPVAMKNQTWLPFITPDDQKNYKLEQARATSNKMVEAIIQEIEEGGIEDEQGITWDSLDEDEQQSAQEDYEQANYSDFYDQFMDEKKQEAIDSAESAAEDDWEEVWNSDYAEEQLTEKWEEFSATLNELNDEQKQALTPTIEDGEYIFDDEAINAAGLTQGQWGPIVGKMTEIQIEAKDAFHDSHVESMKELAESEFDPDEHSDEVIQSSLEAVSEQWHNLSDEEKLSSAGIDGSLAQELEIPGKWKIEKNGEDYKKTRTICRYIQKRVMRETLTARGLNADNIDSQEAIADSWREWKRSSTTPTGLLMQDCAAEELGGRAQAWSETQKQSIEKAALDFMINYGGLDTETRTKMPREDAIKMGREIMKAHVRGTWASTQYALDQAGMNDVYVYRAIMIEKDKIQNEPTAPVKVKAMTFGGQTREDEYKKLTDIKLLRNGLASTAMGREGLAVANSWQGVDLPKPRSAYERVILRVKAPREAIVSVPAFGQNIHSEQEAVLAGLKYEWDAYLDKAPYHADHAIGAK